jgi:hypothetical protein
MRGMEGGRKEGKEGRERERERKNKGCGSNGEALGSIPSMI